MGDCVYFNKKKCKSLQKNKVKPQISATGLLTDESFPDHDSAVVFNEMVIR